MRGKAYRRGGGLDQEPRVCAPFCPLSGRRTKADIVDGGEWLVLRMTLRDVRGRSESP